MAAKVATSCFQWSQPIVNPCSSSSSSKRRSHRSEARALVFRNVPNSALFSIPTSQPHRSRSSGYTKSRTRTTKIACSASLDSFSDEEFSKQIQKLALRFQLSNDSYADSESESLFGSSEINSGVNFAQNHQRPFLNQESRWPEMPPDWPSRDEIIPASIERKANSVDLPLSLRMIKRKMQCEEVLREAGESACCSVKKAFSSMVFIIRELQSFTLQMRESLCFQDFQAVLARVQTELHASFVWLFQQVFSHTPTLMVYVMILLANFTVHSMGCNAAIAPQPVATESVIITQRYRTPDLKFESSSIKPFSLSIGGNSGGGGKFRQIASGTDGGESSNGAEALRFSPLESVIREEEAALWNSIVNEASNLKAVLSLDQETVRRFVAPVSVKIESDDYAEYSKTELDYERGISEEPNNPLILANYAQFLYLVAHDYDRAEEYFKRAIKVDPRDAEALGKYATFLWKARNETWAAEENYLEAINADPTNTYYAANYAHFLWNTGGDDTCYPIKEHDV